MKGKIILIMLCSAIVLVAGTSVAYYNTKSFGFDDRATIVTRDDEKITFLDFEIYYKDINNIYNKIQDIVPENTQVVAVPLHHNVVDI